MRRLSIKPSRRFTPSESAWGFPASLPRVTIAHGGGGKAMRDLIEDVFVSAFDNDTLATLEDQARFNLSELAMHGDRLAMTTDSYRRVPASEQPIRAYLAEMNRA